MVDVAVGEEQNAKPGFSRTARFEPWSCPEETLHTDLADPILTAVYDNCLPGDKCSIIACQKQNGAGDILRFSEPLDGLLFPGGAFLLFRLRRGCQCIREPWQHCVRSNTVIGNIIRQASH